jgi:uncharacterized RmlC-like cupin family protein
MLMLSFLPSLAGGALIGLSAALLLVLNGRIAGISGIVGGLVSAIDARLATNVAFVIYVLSGSIRSQVEGEPARVYRAGESFYEAPGAHHLETLNVSSTEPAKWLAVFVVDTNDKQLTTFDK